MVGLKQNRSIQDEKLIESIFLTNAPQSSSGHPIYGNTPTNLIIDARPTANAVANTAVGAGTENMENYRNCKKIYSGIENIHVMRDSLNKLVEGMIHLEGIFCVRFWLLSNGIHNVLSNSIARD